MAALVPAIIDFVISRARKGRGGGGYGGGGYGGGRGPADPNEQMRKWMAGEFMKELDNISGAMKNFGPDAPRSMVPQIKSQMEGQTGRFTPVYPGVFGNSK